MASAIIVALAQQQIEELTQKLDDLAEKIEIISIMFTEYSQALKSIIRKGG